MPVVSKPVAYALGALVVFAAIYYFQSDAPAAPKKPKVPVVVKKDDGAVAAYLPEDFVKHFDHGRPCDRNLFAAPEVAAKPLLSMGLIDKVPAELAGGDANWIFTGIAVLDGKKMALLENSATHTGDYVTEGTAWKTAKIVRISADGVAFAPKKGAGELVVYRFKPSSTTDAGGKPPAGSLPPAGPIQPMNPQSITGPIGNPGIRFRRGFGAGGGVVIQSVTEQ